MIKLTLRGGIHHWAGWSAARDEDVCHPLLQQFFPCWSCFCWFCWFRHSFPGGLALCLSHYWENWSGPCCVSEGDTPCAKVHSEASSVLSFDLNIEAWHGMACMEPAEFHHDRFKMFKMFKCTHCWRIYMMTTPAEVWRELSEQGLGGCYWSLWGPKWFGSTFRWEDLCGRWLGGGLGDAEEKPHPSPLLAAHLSGMAWMICWVLILGILWDIGVFTWSWEAVGLWILVDWPSNWVIGCWTSSSLGQADDCTFWCWPTPLLACRTLWDLGSPPKKNKQTIWPNVNFTRTNDD